jgi:hypothetical protein
MLGYGKKRFDRIEGCLACVVLHPFGILKCNIFRNPERGEKTKNEAMPLASDICKDRSFGCQKNTAIRPVGHQLFAGQALESLGNRNMANSQACREVNRTRLSRFLDKVLNEFHVVGGALGGVIGASLAERVRRGGLDHERSMKGLNKFNRLKTC